MRAALILLLFVCLTLGLNAQDIDQLLSKYTKENGQNFIQPLANSVGANFNSGMFHSAKIKHSGFQLYFGLVATSAIVSDKSRYFTAIPEGTFLPKDPVKVPTVFGPSENVIVDGTSGTQYVFPGGFNLKFLPFLMPQLSIGSVFGTDLTLRYFTYNPGTDLGKINLLGWGLRHSISQYFEENLPADIAVGYYNQHFRIGEIVYSKNTLVNLQGSYTFGLLALYGAIGYEKSKLNLEYTFENNGVESFQKFSLKGENHFRLTAGATLNLGALKLNADYNLSKQSAFSLGLGVGFGN